MDEDNVEEYRVVYYAQNPCEAEGEIEEREELNYLKGPANVKIVYPNNTTFLGSVDENSMKTGLGRLLMLADDEEEEERERTVYEGEFLNNKFHGLGKAYYKNGDVYHGQWAQGKRNGKGTYFYRNGDIYSGEWVEDAKVGQGEYSFNVEDSFFKGVWADNFFQRGSWETKKGGMFEGHFENNLPIGKGIYFFVNGVQQEGSYVPLGPNGEEIEQRPSTNQATNEQVEDQGKIIISSTRWKGGRISFVPAC